MRRGRPRRTEEGCQIKIMKNLIITSPWQWREVEEKLQQMPEEVEKTDKEREKFIKKDTEEIKKRYRVWKRQ